MRSQPDWFADRPAWPLCCRSRTRSRTPIDRGAVRDCADVARRPGLSRARISQLLDLTLLAPDIQTEVLAIEATW